MPSFITRCPYCETSFNITEEQLRIARGTVRCGFCLQTFSALEHQLFSDTNTGRDEQDAGTNLPGEQTDSVADFSLEYSAEYFTSSQLAESEAEANGDEPSNAELEEEPGIIPDDADLASSLTDLHTVNTSYAATEPENYEDIEASLTSFIEESIESSIEGPDNSSTEESDSNSELIPDNAEYEADASDAPEAEIESAYEEDQHLSDSEEEYELDAYEADLPDDSQANHEPEPTVPAAPVADNPRQHAGEKKPELQSLAALYEESDLEQLEDSNFEAFSDDPINIYHQQQRSGLVKLLLVCANLLLLVALGMQYIWGNLESILQNERLSPLTSVLCSRLECPETQRFDLSSFETEELLVNAHPEIQNALQIDFIFRNTAPYAQQFPLVELNFTDINQRLLANRLFRPDEYLQAELQQFSRIPPQSSVQIRLEIADPGPAAINYTMALRTPAQAR